MQESRTQNWNFICSPGDWGAEDDAFLSGCVCREMAAPDRTGGNLGEMVGFVTGGDADGCVALAGCCGLGCMTTRGGAFGLTKLFPPCVRGGMIVAAGVRGGCGGDDGALLPAIAAIERFGASRDVFAEGV